MTIRRGTPGDLVFVATPEEFNRDMTNNPWDLAFYGSYGAKLNPTNLKNASIKWNVDEGALVIAQHFANASSQLNLEKSRGTSDEPTAVIDGDTLSSIYMSGYDGGQYVLGAFISAVVDGVVDGDSMPTKLVFGTNPNQFAEPQAELLGDGTLRVKRITGFDDAGLEIIFKDGTVQTTSTGGGSNVDNTDQLAEGTQNLYFTTARARNAISTQAVTGVFYNPSTGVINLGAIPNSSLANNSITINGTSVALGGSYSLSFSTSDIAEGSNLYFTTARARSAISAGSGIGYDASTGIITNTATPYTDDMARNAVSAGGDITYNSTTGEFYYVTPNIIQSLANHTTTNLREGTNLYFTQARARSAFTAGYGIIVHGGVIEADSNVLAPITYVNDQLILTRNYIDDQINNINFGAILLNDLEDVTLTQVNHGQYLTYNANIGQWVNSNLPTDPVYITVNSTSITSTTTNTGTLNVKDIHFTGPGPVTFNSNNDLLFNATGDIKFNGRKLKEVAFSGSYNDLIDKPTFTTNKLVNGNLELVLNSNGTLTTPLLLPRTFTATLDTAHCTSNPGASFTAPPWYYDVTFACNPDGTVETQINGNVVWPLNWQPNYGTNATFDFTEADHGIPGYTFTLTVTEVDAFPAGRALNIAASPPPAYPSTIKSLGAIKLTADNKSWILGTNGVLTLPMDGDIVDAYGNSVLGGTGIGAVASVNGKTGVVVLTSSDIDEGTNQYFTNTRARDSISAGSGISYDNSTGVISTTAIPNDSLTNSSITIGTTSVSLGGTATTVAGLTNVVTKKASYADSSNVSKVYTYYNEETQSLDTVFE